ncbi:MAG: hypothetical protein MJZ89_03530 [Paludibacteraceae bacterium]|nr:hypothetical protein [Paludibacteraceae bacterium]
MKKIFTLFAAVVAALSMSAQTPTAMTCAEAASAAAALPACAGNSSDPVTDDNSILAAITGYITNTNGTVSREQQTFFMDDVKNSGARTVQAYWANLPEEDKVTPLAVGEKVVITGRLFNYNGTTPEIKNAEVTVLEHLVVNYDTTEVAICDAIEIGEALNAGDVTEDYYIVRGVAVTANAYNTTYNNQTFDFKCVDNNKVLEAYNVSIENEVAVGDTVEVLGRLTNYNDIKIEFNGGKGTIVGKAVVNTITCNVDFATNTGLALDRGAQSQSRYVITGYVDSISTAYSEQYDNISFFMCDNLAEPTFNFMAYRVKGGADLHVGDKIVLTGYIQHYYKAASETAAEVELVETVAGATYEIAPQSSVESVSIDATAEKFFQGNQLLIRKNGVVYTILGAELH